MSKQYSMKLLKELFKNAKEVAYAASNEEAEYYTLYRLRPTLEKIEKELTINGNSINSNNRSGNSIPTNSN